MRVFLPNVSSNSGRVQVGNYLSLWYPAVSNILGTFHGCVMGLLLPHRFYPAPGGNTWLQPTASGYRTKSIIPTRRPPLDGVSIQMVIIVAAKTKGVTFDRVV